MSVVSRQVQPKSIFLWPTILGVMTLVGLVAALIDDGLLELMAIVLLSIPTVLMLYVYGLKRIF